MEGYSPLTEIIDDLKVKMSKINPVVPSVAIWNETGDIQYIDAILKNRLDYIKDYLATNFHLIDQYSLPLSGTLLGFFKISNRVVMILFQETGKIGTLLAFQGIIKAFSERIDGSIDVVEQIKEIDDSAYELIQLVKIAEGAPVPSPARVATPASTTPEPIARSLEEIYPYLEPKFTKKKFSYKEGLILQHCTGKNSIPVIAQKSNFTEYEIQEIIQKYEGKGWLTLKFSEK